MQSAKELIDSILEQENGDDKDKEKMKEIEQVVKDLVSQIDNPEIKEACKEKLMAQFNGSDDMEMESIKRVAKAMKK